MYVSSFLSEEVFVKISQGYKDVAHFEKCFHLKKGLSEKSSY